MRTRLTRIRADPRDHPAIARAHESANGSSLLNRIKVASACCGWAHLADGFALAAGADLGGTQTNRCRPGPKRESSPPGAPNGGGSFAAHGAARTAWTPDRLARTPGLMRSWSPSIARWLELRRSSAVRGSCVTRLHNEITREFQGVRFVRRWELTCDCHWL